MAPLRARPPSPALTAGGSGRSTAVRPGASCSKISGSSICSPRLPLKVPVTASGVIAVSPRRGERRSPFLPRQGASAAHPYNSLDSSEYLFERRDQRVHVGIGRGFGGAQQEQVRERRIVRVEARGRDAAEEAALGERVDDGGGWLWQPQREFVEEGVVDDFDALYRREVFGETDRSRVVELCQARKPGFAEQRQVDREGERTEAGVGADVAGRLLA